MESEQGFELLLNKELPAGRVLISYEELACNTYEVVHVDSVIYEEGDINEGDKETSTIILN